MTTHSPAAQTRSKVRRGTGAISWMVVVLDRATGATMEEIFRRDLETSQEFLLPAWGRRSMPHRLGDWMARGLSPVL